MNENDAWLIQVYDDINILKGHALSITSLNAATVTL
jgi:hypothetical protein